MVLASLPYVKNNTPTCFQQVVEPSIGEKIGQTHPFCENLDRLAKKCPMGITWTISENIIKI